MNIEAINKKLVNRINDNGINNVSIKAGLTKTKIKQIISNGIRNETMNTLDKICIACDELELLNE